MHENHAFPRYLSAGEVLSFYGGLTRVDSAQLDVRIPALLERVGLADRNREPISRFSKGMVQRLGLAQAVINEPDLLILDEPTEGLDLLGRQLLKDIVREYRAAGKTVILVSHALAEVEELCDRAAVLVQGRVAFEGTLPELRSQVNGSSATLELALRSLYTQAQTPTVAR
jgi:ABC-2 type transport system ATP-binding protein